MPKFYMTFGQGQCTKLSKTPMHNYYLEVEAKDGKEAYDKLITWTEQFMESKTHYFTIYPEDKFDPSFYPKGDFYLGLKGDNKKEEIGKLLHLIISSTKSF